MAPMDKLRAFACSRNEFQRKDHIVDFTVYVVLKNMRAIAVSLAIDRGTVLQPGKRLPHGFLKDVADRYCDGKGFASDTIRQMAGVVVKLTTLVIEAIGAIVNEENPELARKATLRRNKRETVNSIDGRTFRKTINTYTLRGATKVLGAREDVDRVNALYRVNFLAQEYNYKGTTREVLEQQIERAIAARVEAQKLETMLESKEWPERLELVKNDLLRTTKLDTEVERNEGNDSMLLPSLEKFYKDVYGTLALHKIQAWSRSFNPSPTIHNDNSQDIGQKKNAQEGQEDEEQLPGASGQPDFTGPGSGEDCTLPKNCISHPTHPPADPCRVLGIETFQMKFDAYDAQCFGDTVCPFDMILGDLSITACFPGEPVGNKVVVDDKAMDEFAQFAGRVLVTGGYLFLFTTIGDYKGWNYALSSRSFEVMSSPFIVVREISTVQSQTVAGGIRMFLILL